MKTLFILILTIFSTFSYSQEYFYNQQNEITVKPISGDCGDVVNSCNKGIVDNISQNENFFLWDCKGSFSGDTSSCSLNKPVNGICGDTLNSCDKGEIKDIEDNTNAFLWNCDGLYNGENAECSLGKAEDGVCSSSKNRCINGTFSDRSDTEGYFRWRCLGVNGGNTDSCRKERVPECGTTKYTCVYGDVTNAREGSGDFAKYYWTCQVVDSVYNYTVKYACNTN